MRQRAMNVPWSIAEAKRQTWIFQLGTLYISREKPPRRSSASEVAVVDDWRDDGDEVRLHCRIGAQLQCMK